MYLYLWSRWQAEKVSLLVRYAMGLELVIIGLVDKTESAHLLYMKSLILQDNIFTKFTDFCFSFQLRWLIGEKNKQWTTILKLY